MYGYGVTKETKLNDTQLLQQYLATSSQEPPCDNLLYNDLKKMSFFSKLLKYASKKTHRHSYSAYESSFPLLLW